MTEPMTDRPTKPGIYWMRKLSREDAGQYGWMIADVDWLSDGTLFVAQPGHEDLPDLTEPEFDGREWIGPIAATDAAELVRLRSAGKILVEAAKQATIRLIGADNSQIRDRLCNAIAAWLELTLDNDGRQLSENFC